ncbi:MULTISPECIES: hypothetical protein [Nostoc]|uniref:Pre-toxin TG domain-containing protein n=1 Tax=Nostoc paludosum FACHB-159 TaxID=2692908 RepID=A0ABR8KFY0_9NOSO|nr:MULTISPECIES: hypothetical protein [Nostoc]MBD2681277.1 hypothetical protein [Nostoc sp. FACHB-857]MBD2737756.1 hypothetical protein [Nostoc paludosum FACHB-159]
MAYKRLQKSAKSASIQRRQFYSPSIDELIQADLQTSSRKAISTIPSQPQRDAIYRSIFGNLAKEPSIHERDNNYRQEADGTAAQVVNQTNTSNSQTLQRFNIDIQQSQKTPKIHLIKNIIHKTFGTDFSTTATPEQQQQLAEQGLTPEMATKVAQAISNFERKKAEIIAKLKVERIAKFQRYGYPIQEARLRAEKDILEKESFQELENEAFQELPPEYRPTPIDVKSKLLHDIKKQFSIENKYENKLTYTNNFTPPKSTSEKLKGYIKTSGSILKPVAEVGGVISKEFASSDGAAKVFNGVSNGIDVLTHITDTGYAIAKVVEGAKKWANKSDVAIKKQGKEQVIEGGIEFKDNLIAATLDAMYLAKSIGSKNLGNTLDVTAIPLLNIAINANLLKKNADEMDTATDQAHANDLLHKEAKYQKHSLENAVGLIGKRMTHIAIRKAVDVVINVINIVGDTLKLGGITTVAGMVIKYFGTAINVAKKLGEQLVDSYQAGKAQEAAFNTRVNAVGNEDAIFQRHPKFAAAAIVVMAKQSDKLAIKMLKTMGIDESDIRRKSAKQLREQILNISHLKEEGKTLTQQGQEKFDNTKRIIKNKIKVSIPIIKDSAIKLTKTVPGQLVNVAKSVKKFALIDSESAAIISQMIRSSVL